MLSPYRYRSNVSGAETSNKPLLVTFAQGGYTFVDAEAPAGTKDGVNPTFTLTVAPNPTGSLMLVLNRVVLLQGTDYTLSGLTLTMLGGNIPQASDTFEAWFRY